jgi:hypothetical protein
MKIPMPLVAHEVNGVTSGKDKNGQGGLSSPSLLFEKGWEWITILIIFAD